MLLRMNLAGELPEMLLRRKLVLPVNSSFLEDAFLTLMLDIIKRRKNNSI